MPSLGTAGLAAQGRPACRPLLGMQQPPPPPPPAAAPLGRRRPPHSMRRPLLPSPAALPTSAAPLTTLADWLTSRGALPADGSVTLVPSASPDAPPTLALTRLPAPGAPLLAVPEAAWISVETTRASPALAGPAVEAAGLEPWARLALALIHARRDASDPLHPYAAALPPAGGGPLFWADPADLAELGGTQAGEAVDAYRSFFAARHTSLEDALFGRDRETFPADAYSAAHFAWAACTVRARVHPPLEGAAAAIVPGIDLVTHARAGRANAGELRVVAGSGSGGGGGGGGVLGGLLGGGGGGSASAPSRLARLEPASTSSPSPPLLPLNTPLSLDYGPSRTDGQLLLDYGCLDEAAALGGTGNPGWSLSLAIPPGDRFADDKADILHGAGLASSPDPAAAAVPLLLTPSFGRGPAGGPAAEDALAVLRLINLSGGDAFLLEPVFRAAAWGHMQAPISLANERAACESMVAGCTAALARFVGSGGEAGDEAALATGMSAVTGAPLTPRGRAATVVRLGERRALAAARSFFEARAAGAEGLEFYQERRLKGLGLLDEGGRTTYDSFFEDGIA